MKKVLALFLGIVLVFGVSACSIPRTINDLPSADNSSSSTATTTPTQPAADPTPQVQNHLDPILVESGWYTRVANDGTTTIWIGATVNNPNGSTTLYGVHLTATVSVQGAADQTVDLKIQGIVGGDTRLAATNSLLNAKYAQVTGVKLAIADFSTTAPATPVQILDSRNLRCSLVTLDNSTNPPTINGTIVNNSNQAISNVAVTVVYRAPDGSLMGPGAPATVYNVDGINNVDLPAAASGSFSIPAGGAQSPDGWAIYGVYLVG
ncbi:MAG: hypothetical protein FWC59_01915 [Actinomycetia bacterium]|nr:hypothetical protein [Actinomycetes bacterium]